MKKKIRKSNNFKIILIVFCLQLFVTGCVKYCKNLMVSSSDENHVTLVMQGSYNKCTETDIMPKANSECEIFGKEALYTGQRRIHRQLLYVDFVCKANETNQLLQPYNNQQEKRIKPNEIPETELIRIEPGDWDFVTKDANGNRNYYDKDRVRKSGKYLYVWHLTDYFKPSVDGDLSHIVYIQLDCSVLRINYLQYQLYNNSMGRGKITLDHTSKKDEWHYANPNTAGEFIYNKICKENQM